MGGICSTNKNKRYAQSVGQKTLNKEATWVICASVERWYNGVQRAGSYEHDNKPASLYTQGKHEKMYVSFSVEAFILFVRHTCSSVHPNKSQIINPEVKLLNVK